jgi:nitrite reductase/ring-hydroxylating ferredoxin subunit
VSATVRERRKLRVCGVEEVPPGGRVVRDVDGRSVGVFNVDGDFFALHNRCPHKGGALCLGPLTGTSLPTSEFRYEYGRSGRVLRCAWHGWEFDIETGRSLVDPRVRAKTFPVEVDEGSIYVLV